MFILYNLMVFLTGFLILSVQLVFGKSILPIFGGTPSVWLTSLAFYQIVLTLGYLYSYLMQKKVKLKNQIIIHISLFLFSLILIPVSLNGDFVKTFNSESFNLFITTMLSIGLPYFLLTASSPLIQNWFGHSNLEKSNNPYILYVSSNLGTFLSLLLYPFLIEIYLSTSEQFNLWSILFVLEIILIIICGTFLYKNKNKKTEPNATELIKSKITKKEIFYWISLAFIPSALLSVITNKITVDIAPIPLLWIIPLGIYFLSFSIGFSDRFKKQKLFNNLSLFSLIILLFVELAHLNIQIVFVIFYLFPLFFVSILFHNNLYKNSPNKEHLTLFYLFLSVGGALGGSFVGILSPLIFSDYIEFDIIIFLTFLTLIYLSKNKVKKYTKKSNIILFFPVLFLLFSFHFIQTTKNENELLYKERTFFGVNKVYQKIIEKNNTNYKINKLKNGTTLHGAQIIAPMSESKKTLTYYSFENPLYLSLKDFNDKKEFKNLGVIGLGSGAMNCMFENKNIDFFEIDKEMLNIAKKHFTYLNVCKNNKKFIIGDARIKIKEIKDNKFDALVVDAFSSDAIPIHLLTQESVKMYKEKITKNGMISFHISNRYLDLEPVLGNIAKSLNLKSKICKMKEKKSGILTTGSIVLVMSDNLDFLTNNCWIESKTDNNNIWNDNYSNLFNYLIF